MIAFQNLFLCHEERENDRGVNMTPTIGNRVNKGDKNCPFIDLPFDLSRPKSLGRFRLKKENMLN